MYKIAIVEDDDCAAGLIRSYCEQYFKEHPAEFDTGACLNMMILSVPEGHDKPLKYPLIFQVCQGMVVNKIDVLPYFDFDMEQVIQFARMRNPELTILPVSAKTGEGVPALADWLKQKFQHCKESGARRLDND